MTTAGAGVNTFFPVVAKNAGVDMSKIELVNVAEGALVSSYLQNLAPAILGGIDDKPAEIVANGGEQPIIFNYTDYGVYQPGYSIVAHKDMVAENPDLVRRFVARDAEGSAGGQGRSGRRDPVADQLVGRGRGPEGPGTAACST